MSNVEASVPNSFSNTFEEMLVESDGGRGSSAILMISFTL